MLIEAGKRYMAVCGEITSPLTNTVNSDVYMFIDNVTHRTYSIGGMYARCDPEHQYNLVSEYIEPGAIEVA